MRAGPAVAAAVLAAVLAACGVQHDDSPRRMATGQVPYGLLEEAPAPTTSTTVPAVPKQESTVYMVAGDRLRPVVRQVTDPVTISKVLAILLAGPEEEEAVAGLRSAINPKASLLPTRTDPSTYVVDLGAEFAQGPISEQVLGLAQIVFSATELPGVTGVRFTLEGAPIAVPVPSGTTSGPVGREAFAGLAPLPDPAVPS